MINYILVCNKVGRTASLIEFIRWQFFKKTPQWVYEAIEGEQRNGSL